MPDQCLALGRFSKYLETHQKATWCILIYWFLALVVGGLGAMAFIPRCLMSFEPGPGTPSYDANTHFGAVFPSESAVTQFACLVQVDEGTVMDYPHLENFSDALLWSLNSTGDVITFQSAPKLLAELGSAAAASLISPDGTATLIQWTVPGKCTTSPALTFAEEFEDRFAEVKAAWLPDISFAGILSVPTLATNAISDSEVSLGKMDAIALPLAFFVLWLVVESLRLLVIPVFTMMTSLSVSFGIMYVVTYIETVQQTTPSLMMSILIAMSIDYSLFLLTRFRQELETYTGGDLQGFDEAAQIKAVRRCVYTMMQTAGFTVLLSGLTLTVSFLAMWVSPVDIIASLGVGCAVALCVALTVHLTLVPALMLSFPLFFCKSVGDTYGRRFLATCIPCCIQSQPARVRNKSGTEVTPRHVAQALNPDDVVVPSGGQKHHPFWEWLADRIVFWPNNLIVVLGVCALTIAVGWAVVELEITNEVTLNTPRGSVMAAGLERLTDTFGIGAMMPYKLLVEPTSGHTVYSNSFWTASQQALQELQRALPRTTPENLIFPSFAQGFAIPYALVQTCRGRYGDVTPGCKQIQFSLDQFVNDDHSAFFGYVMLTFDPMIGDGQTWLDTMRALIDVAETKYPLRLTLIGDAADALDIIEQTFNFFPWMIVLTLVVALSILGFAFKSLLIPLRSVMSIGLTLLWVYGLSVFVYQKGALNWTHFPGLSGKYGAQCWMIPIICFSVVVGICLDYDIFFLSRATECREEGMSAADANHEALCSTGGIIAAAGLIMAIAFGGLMFASMLPLNALSFYMVVAVLYDTLVVEALLTPALMSLMGVASWWPSKLGYAHYTTKTDDKAASMQLM